MGWVLLATQAIEARAQRKDAGKPVRLVVYKRGYKARERKGEKEDGWCGRLVQISCKGRQGASGNRDNRRKQYHTI